MSTPREPAPAKLVIGMFMRERGDFSALAEELDGMYGPIDLVSPWLAFDFTSYYTPEMGSPLYRRVLAFEPLIAQENLPEVKLYTNTLEAQRMEGGRRTVNIDPGYLLAERFVLATGKNFSHRIYLRHGIYADLTLVYTRQQFRTLPWTYPDYAAPEMISFLRRVRQKYSRQRKQAETGDSVPGDRENSE
jgi:hypothetical protein